MIQKGVNKINRPHLYRGTTRGRISKKVLFPQRGANTLLLAPFWINDPIYPRWGPSSRQGGAEGRVVDWWNVDAATKWSG